MTPAVIWQWWEPFACFIHCEGQSSKTVPTDHNLWRERRAEAGLNQGPYGSHFIPCKTFRIYSGICSLIMRDWQLVQKEAGLSSAWNHLWVPPTFSCVCRFCLWSGCAQAADPRRRKCQSSLWISCLMRKMMKTRMKRKGVCVAF